MGAKDVGYGFDDFGKPKVLPIGDSIANTLINLLFLKPGQIPSQPYLGIDITQYLYGFADDMVDASIIKTAITQQAPYLLEYIDVASIQLKIITDENNQGIMYIFVPLFIENSMIAIGIKQATTDTGTSPFNYKIIDTSTTP